MKKKAICLLMVGLLFVGAAMPKKAYAVTGVDDAAVAIVLALLGAAGITFATNDGVQDAVSDFLKTSGGKYDSTLEKLSAAAVTTGGMTCFKIPVATWTGVKTLLEGLFDYFKTDENRQGSVTITGDADVLSFPFCLSVADSRVSAYLGLQDVKGDSPIYVIAWAKPNTAGVPDGDIKIGILSLSKFSGSYYDTWDKKRVFFKPSERNLSETLSQPIPDGFPSYVFYNGIYLTECFDSDYSPLFGLSASALPLTPGFFGYKGYPVVEDFVKTLIGLSDGAEKALPYGLTFPQDMTAPDVIDNFEQKVKEGAGDTAIAIPADGVIDSTLPWADAWEKYLVNVNEVGEIGDTVTETNTWLGKILTEVKAIPAKIAALLESLLMKLFYPSDMVLSSGFDGLMAAFKEKTDAQTYLDLLSRFKSLQDPDLADITVNWNGNTYVVLTWDFFRRTKATYSRWLRGFLYLFLLLFNFNNIYKLIRNGSVFGGSGHGSVHNSGEKKRGV